MKILVMNYLFSGWIENLGVVPLFLFWAFLLVPIFFLLFALLLRVTLVLDTMVSLLPINKAKSLISLHLKRLFLQPARYSVKALLLSFFILFSTTYANDGVNNDESIFMARGAYKELQLENMLRFTIGNKEVLSYKLQSRNKKLIIKGKSVGHSEILVWKKDGKKKRYKVFVEDKRGHKNLLQLSDKLKALSINTEIYADSILLNGQINEIETYKKVVQIIRDNKKTITSNLELSDELRNMLLGIIYKDTLSEFVNSINCSIEGIAIICRYNADLPPSKSLIQYLKSIYEIQFIPLSYSKSELKNYSIRFKIIQLESSEGESLNKGLNQLRASIGQLYEDGLKSLITNNQITLAGSNVELNAIAEPRTIISLDDETSIEVGAEIPFVTGASEGVNTTKWKFAGLRIKLRLEKIGKVFRLKYSTNMSRPSPTGRVIVGSKEKSSTLLKLNTPLEVFNISYTADGAEGSFIPYIGQVPILGKLFSSSSKDKTQKLITAVVYLEEHEL